MHWFLVFQQLCLSVAMATQNVPRSLDLYDVISTSMGNKLIGGSGRQSNAATDTSDARKTVEENTGSRDEVEKRTTQAEDDRSPRCFIDH